MRVFGKGLIMSFLFLLLYVHLRAQNVTLKGQNTSLKKLLTEIKKQTGCTFFYDRNLLRDAAPVTIDVSNVPMATALRQCLAGQALDFEIQNKTVFITRKRSGPNGTKNEATESGGGDTGLISIRGRVTDKAGVPLSAATVLASKEKLTTITNGSGEFNLYAPKDAVLEISYIGYATRKILGKPDMGTVILAVASNELDESHVIGYGTESRRFSLGSTGVVKAETIERQPVTNLLSALQGQVAGVNITSTSGAPGSAITVQIRGQNTLRNAVTSSLPYDQPLFIIDGVPFAPQNKNIGFNGYLFNSNITPSGYSPFNSINPDDIESISFLKDADATSIYGSQGANGVILITTKKSKPGKTGLELGVRSGYNSNTKPFKMLNTEQYLQLRKDAFTNDSITPSISSQYDPSYAPDLLVFDQKKYTDFYRQLFEKTSSSTDVHASLSGGTMENNFIASAGYTKSDYSFPGDFEDNRYSLHAAMHHGSVDKRLSVDFVTDMSYDRNNTAGNPLALSRIFLSPNLPDLLDASGALVWNYKGVNLGNLQFYNYLKQPSVMQVYTTNNSLRLGYKLMTGLSLSVNMGYSRLSTIEKQATPAFSQNPSNFPTSNASFSNGLSQTINIEPQVDYRRRSGKGDLSIMIGGTYKKNSNDNTEISGYNYSSDELLGAINGAATVNAFSNYDLYKYSSVFGRVGYIYDQEFIVSFTGRRDGSSNFGPDHRWGNFGSAALGWIFSQEKLFKDALAFVSYAKLSGSYGTNGSDGVQSYQYQPFWQPVNYVPTFQNIRPFQALNLYQPNYSWATKRSLNMGLDLGLFQDRLLINATYYRSREGNQLISYKTPIQTGFSSVVENLDATIQNSGWEFTVTSTNIKSKDFSWTSSFNISFNRNKLVAYPNLELSSYVSQYVIGRSTSLVRLFDYKGVNPATGLFEFIDANGKTTNEPDYSIPSRGGDLTKIVDLQPKFFGGLGNDFRYKRWNLSLFFQFSKQTAPNYLSYLYNSALPGTMYNQPTEILNKYWKAPGDHSSLQRLTTGYSDDASSAGYSFATSTGAYSDDTYLRLKTLALSYSLPNDYLKRLGLKDCRLYLQAQNLLTITNYKAGDPEQPGNMIGFPLQRTVVAGLSLNF